PRFRVGTVREPGWSWLRQAGSAVPSWSNPAVFEATAEQWCAWLGFGSASFSPALIRATPAEKQRQSGWSSSLTPTRAIGFNISPNLLNVQRSTSNLQRPTLTSNFEL